MIGGNYFIHAIFNAASPNLRTFIHKDITGRLLPNVFHNIKKLIMVLQVQTAEVLQNRQAVLISGQRK
jgi:hypothetical protein